MKLYTFGCNTYDGKLVEIKIPAGSYDKALKTAKKMRDAGAEIIDKNSGLWLNDTEEYI